MSLTRNQKIVYIESGNRCAIPECRRELIAEKTDKDKEAIIGELAHIKGENPKSARYDPNMNDTERNSSDNLILVCAVCHKRIDDQPNTYPAERLTKIKLSHKEWVISSTGQAILNITFTELREITKYLLSSQIDLDVSYTLIPPKDKIKKNNLSSQTENLITMGMTQVKRVKDFINANPDIEFGEKLKQGFVVKYEQLKNQDRINGDELFNRLLDFASGSNARFDIRAAGLAVLTYLFEKCEVFEK